MPPSFAVPSARTMRPRKALRMLSGCSWISFSMKCGKPPRSMAGRSKAIRWTGLGHRAAREGAGLEPVGA